MAGSVKKLTGRDRRKARVRKKVTGSAVRPRLNVFRSNKHIYAQLIEDTGGGKTLISASTKTKDLSKDVDKLNKTDAAKKVGEYIGKLVKDKGIEKVVFDRAGYLYHGRVKALADGGKVCWYHFLIVLK